MRFEASIGRHRDIGETSPKSEMEGILDHLLLAQLGGTMGHALKLSPSTSTIVNKLGNLHLRLHANITIDFLDCICIDFVVLFIDLK